MQFRFSLPDHRQCEATEPASDAAGECEVFSTKCFCFPHPWFFIFNDDCLDYHHSFKTLKNNSGHYDFNGKEPIKSFFFITYQDMQSEVPSQESLLESLETRAESLYSSASEERMAELRDLHCSMEERWCSLSTNIPLR